MSVTQIIRAGDCPEVAWKNGGGTTREIAVFPPGASMDDFLWRLSMARVEKAGAFSTFAGIDRVLAVLDGVLHLSGPAPDVRLDGASAPYAFDGAAAVTGEPVDGPVLDLNAMGRRGACHIVMQRLRAGDVAPSRGAGFLVALEAQQLGDSMLERWDCVRMDGPLPVMGPSILVQFVLGV